MSWRTFKFFELEELKDPDTNQPYDKLKEIGITCSSCGRGQMILGDAQGEVHIMTSLRDMTSFNAYLLRVNFIYQLKQRNIFLTVGDDEEFKTLIKIWNFEKRTKEGLPTLMRTIRPSVPGNPQTLTVLCVTAHENMNLIAVGFKDGTVLLIRGNITRDRLSRIKPVHHESEPGIYITGLGFRQMGNRTFLMISTTAAVYSMLIGDTEQKHLLDSIGCLHNCSTMTDHTQEHKFVIARNEAFHFYTTEAKAQCLAFEGEKFLIRWFRGYLISVSKGGRGGGARGGSLAAASGGSGESMTLTIYDIQNQFLAYQTTFSSRVIDVLSEWGSLYVILKDGSVKRLDENDTKTKLETLFKKNLYPTAISLAKSQSYNDGLIDIFTQYGDHLYTKGDFDGAIAQYILTIGKLEPSYVIRKFLDAQRIHNLTNYLKALHEKGAANADHTTLLLNCYTKLKDIDQLDKFVSEDQNLTFDVTTAIKVCRQANYHQQAITLARKYSKHDWYLRIQLEDLSNNTEGMAYIAQLPFKEAEENMRRYGKRLMSSFPDKTTQLLTSLCTDWIPIGHTKITSRSPDRADPANYIEIFVNNKQHLMRFLEHMIKVHAKLREVVYNTLLELYLNEIGTCRTEEGVAKEMRALELLKRPEASYDLDHALVLAQMHDFKDGILYLYEKALLFQQILQYHMEHNDYDQVMDTCKRHGRQDPNLWVQALSYFASVEKCKDFIAEVLHHIEANHLMPPLMVVQTLADSQYATLNDIKPYILKHLQEVNDQIAKDEQLVKQYRDDTTKMRDQIKELQTSAKIFQVMKCHYCRRGLALPALHFLCGHSFHQGCLDDEFDNECPTCARENRKVLDVIQRQEQTGNLHEQFHSQLSRSTDGFTVVADYFGRGVFNKTKPAEGGSKRPSLI
ncbi:vacuolar protein sorting-associated protein 11 homolog [Halichondria panicea]|uniref:vacuolar protein sorting-associated protein 11 homolog n=1 Tax=Halichondria panicea TaxID=6063 RepID=UPI00312BAC2E